MAVLAGCGPDAEGRYAGLRSAEIDTTELSYRIRYLAPPWRRVNDDALVTGTRKSVQVGGAQRDIVEGSGLVLAIDRETSFDEVGLTYAKYVLQAAVLRCTAGELAENETCAKYLAGRDFAARAESEDSGFFGDEEQENVNDAGQRFWELMTREPELYRYRRLAFFETGDRLSTVWLYIDANPGLADPVTSRMIKTLEILSADNGGDPSRTGVAP